MAFKFNWGLAAVIATESLAVIAPQVSVIGGADHVAGAQAALTAAGQVAASVITDPTQQQEMVSAYTAAAAVLGLIASFQKNNTGLGTAVAPPAK